MKILAIETSCDDTCIAIINSKSQNPNSKMKFGGFDVLSNIVSSQVKLHSKYGGVYPTLAKREHQKNLVPVLIQALKKAKLFKTQNSPHQSKHGTGQAKLKAQSCNSKLKTISNILIRENCLFKKIKRFFKNYRKPKVDAIAVTVGPGLEPCLWVGINFAKSLAHFWNLPIIPVNHIEAHLFANFIGKEPITKNYKPKTKLFPAICLVVSGGHTQLILMRGFRKYKIIGETRDDAAGECFDKVARILGLGYPGGPAIAAEAAKLETINHKPKVKLPRPMMHTKDYDFSFSGLKTAVLYLVKQLTTNNKQLAIEKKREICAETQQAIIEVLIHKTIKAAKEYGARTIIIGGGVAANDELKKQFKLKIKNLKLKINFLLPDKKLCTDNATMVGTLACYRQKRRTKNWRKIEAEANLSI